MSQKTRDWTLFPSTLHPSFFLFFIFSLFFIPSHLVDARVEGDGGQVADCNLIGRTVLDNLRAQVAALDGSFYTKKRKRKLKYFLKNLDWRRSGRKFNYYYLKKSGLAEGWSYQGSAGWTCGCMRPCRACTGCLSRSAPR
jgi:hypothetical protein